MVVQAALVTEHWPASVGQFALDVQTFVFSMLHLPAFGHSALVLQEVPVLLHTPESVGHCALDVHAALLTVHFPAAGHCASAVQDPPVWAQVPGTIGQSASLVHALPVWMLQLPTSGHVVLRVQGGHSPPVHRLQPGGSYAVVQPVVDGLKLVHVWVLTLLQVWPVMPPQLCVLELHVCAE